MKKSRPIGYAILFLLAILAINTCSYFKKGLEESSATPEGQRHEIVDGKPIIYSKLVQKTEVKIPNAYACGKETEALLNATFGGYQYGSLCVKDVCTTTIDFKDGKIPEAVKLSLSTSRKTPCKTQTINTKDYTVVTGYQAKIGINGDLKDLFRKMDSHSGLKKLPATQATGFASFGVNGNYSLTLDYKEPVPSDVFLFNDTEVKAVFQP